MRTDLNLKSLDTADLDEVEGGARDPNNVSAGDPVPLA